MTTSIKEKILLTEEQETLLIPLYSKAVESQRPDPILVDEKAQQILESVEYDFAGLKIPCKTEVMVCMRAKKLDEYTRAFLAGNPESVVLHLGCGLDSRCSRVDAGRSEWYDLDVPEVIELRRKFYPETEAYHLIPSSVTDLGWIDRIDRRDRPALAVAEGLFMYLKEDDVKALVLRLKEAFQGCELAFDAFSVLTARSAAKHPSVKKTGAATHWGIDDARVIERWAKGIRLKEEWYFTQSEDLQKLEPGFSLRIPNRRPFSGCQKGAPDPRLLPFLAANSIRLTWLEQRCSRIAFKDIQTGEGRNVWKKRSSLSKKPPWNAGAGETPGASWRSAPETSARWTPAWPARYTAWMRTRNTWSRWRKGDPWGFIEISAPEVTYFDTGTPRRINGREALQAEYAQREGKIFYDVMDFVDPRVQVCGEMAVLVYRFLSTWLGQNCSVANRTPWNCTEVFLRMGGQWRIIHTHWSYIKGERGCIRE